MELPALLWVTGLLALALGIAGWLSHRLRLPPALGYLAVGALAAPTVTWTPDVPFKPESLEVPAQIGVLFLLFAIGLELDLKRLREILRKGVIVLPLDILVPALLITAAGKLAGWTLLQAAVLGLTLSLSSTIFGERMTATAGFPLVARQRTLGVLLAQDVAAVALLALFAVLGDPQTSGNDWLAPALSMGRLLFYFVLVTAAALLLVPRVLDLVARAHSHELMVLAGAAAVLGFGWLGWWAGSPELGALVAGVAAAEAGSRFVVRNGLQAVRDLALALFFFAAGLATDLTQVALHPWLILSVSGLFLLAKLIVHVPAGIAAGLPVEGSVRSALALSTVGEFNLILVGAAASFPLLGNKLLGTAVVGAMVVLLIASPLLLRLVPKLVGMFERMPDGLRKRLSWIVQSVRQTRTGKKDPRRSRASIILAANIILLAAWILLAVASAPYIVASIPRLPTFANVAVTAVTVGIALPLCWAIYRSYRHLVDVLLHLGEGQQNTPANRAKARLVDIAVSLTSAVLLLPLTLLIPVALPVLLIGLTIAVLFATISWRQLGGFHRTLEATVTRVLGQEADAHAILDRVMDEYPWGVRFSAVALPKGSPVAGNTLEEARIGELTGAKVAVLQRRGHEVVNPSSQEHLYVGDTLILMGDTHQIERAEALIVSHGDALRLTAQSRLATVVEVTVRPGSPLVGVSLGDADVHTRTGTLVVGVWPEGGRHPAPYRSDIVLREGDRIILLGSSLQVERARLLAEGQEESSVVEAAGDDGVSPSAPIA